MTKPNKDDKSVEKGMEYIKEKNFMELELRL